MTPYRTEFSIKNDKIVLLGAVPDLNTKNRLIAIANQRFKNNMIDDQLVVSRTAPDQWSSVAEFTMTELIKFNNGSVSIDETTVTIKGNTGQQTAIIHGRPDIESKLPDRFNLIYDIQVEDLLFSDDNESKSSAKAPGPDIKASRHKCIENFTQTHNQLVIRFKPNKFDLSNRHHQYLDELSKNLIDCSNLIIQISGHSDAQGSAEYNRKLSLKRAQTVADYLQQNSVYPNQFLVTGYGENKPIASNDNEKGRKLNRRVELNIQENGR